MIIKKSRGIKLLKKRVTKVIRNESLNKNKNTHVGYECTSGQICHPQVPFVYSGGGRKVLVPNLLSE